MMVYITDETQDCYLSCDLQRSIVVSLCAASLLRHVRIPYSSDHTGPITVNIVVVILLCWYVCGCW